MARAKPAKPRPAWGGRTGLMLAIFVGQRWQRAAAIEASGLPRRIAFLWHGAVRYLSPLVILVVLFAGLFAI